ncbi:MAG: dethiobiotin synthase [Fuerstiella sp.]
MNTLLVTGTDTNVGKTWVSCLLIRRLRSRGAVVGAYKPVCSGAIRQPDGSLQWDDIEQLRLATGRSASVDEICPQRFEAAVAPNVAARLQGTTVDDVLLRSAADRRQQSCDSLIIEGAGGLLCPLSDQSTVADLAADLNAPILIVAANRLGVLNHTLMTMEVARGRQLAIAGIVLNNGPGSASEADSSCASNLSELQRWIPPLPLFLCESDRYDLQPVCHTDAAVGLLKSAEF